MKGTSNNDTWKKTNCKRTKDYTAEEEERNRELKQRADGIRPEVDKTGGRQQRTPQQNSAQQICMHTTETAHSAVHNRSAQ